MPVLHETTTPAELAACSAAATPCPACVKRAGRDVPEGRIHSYGSEPTGGWRPRRLGDSDATAPTFGIELETQHEPVTSRAAGPAPEPRYSDAWYAWSQRTRDAQDAARRLRLTGSEAVAAARPAGHWYAQQDGSVDGPEFASQPATLAYWRSITGPVGTFMRTLIHGGLRSHDGAYSCSMHVNIGDDAFTDAAHLARFCRLATVNPRWSTRLGQRTHEQVRSWARFDEYPDMAACTTYADAHMRNGSAYMSHSAAVNLGNYGRVEFRVPRGTLRLDRFMAKLEWVAAMVEYTRDATRRPVPGAFTSWAAADGGYPMFVAMVAELMPARLDPSAARPRPAPAPVVDATPATDSERSCNLRQPVYPYAACDRADGHFGMHAHGSSTVWRSMRAETAEQAAETYPDTVPAYGDMCTCGATWGGHNARLCPSGDRCWVRSQVA